MFVDTCSRKTLYMMATLHACYIWSCSHRIDLITCMTQTTAAGTCTNSHTAWQTWNYTCTASGYTKRAFKTGSRCQNAKIAFAKLWWFASSQNLKKITLHTSHSTLHTLLTAAFTLQTSHFTLHTALFALQTNAATARSNLDAAITMRSAETELQNTIELRATASEIVAPKPDLDARAKKRRFWSTF